MSGRYSSRLKLFQHVLDVGDPVSQAKIYEAQFADEFLVVNIDGTPIRDDEAMLGLIERLARRRSCRLSVGGGVRDAWATSHSLLERGADKVCVNTVAVRNPRIIREAAAGSVRNAS